MPRRAQPPDQQPRMVARGHRPECTAGQPAQLNPNLMDDFDYAGRSRTSTTTRWKRDLTELMTDSREWWSADYGHYGPLFIRMSCTLQVRTASATAAAVRSGEQRFCSAEQLAHNTNLDKAGGCCGRSKESARACRRRTCWSWPETWLWSNGLLRRSGSPVRARGCLRARARSTGANEDEWLDDKRYSGEARPVEPLAAVQMGLIYVNPEGPNGQPSAPSARHIRETFARMNMNDEETVA